VLVPSEGAAPPASAVWVRRSPVELRGLVRGAPGARSVATCGSGGRCRPNGQGVPCRRRRCHATDWCARRGSNPHGPYVGHQVLNLARLPVPPRTLVLPTVESNHDSLIQSQVGCRLPQPGWLSLAPEDSNLDNLIQSQAGCHYPKGDRSPCGGGGTRTPEGPSGPQPFSRRCPRPAGPPP
jgi:hypothetical protein